MAVATLILLVGGGVGVWYFFRRSQLPEQPAGRIESAALPQDVSAEKDALAFISEGERFFFDSDRPQKQAAALAYKQGDYAAAIPRLEALRKQ
jgi:hypothetical protein